MKRVAVLFAIVGAILLSAYFFTRSKLKTPHFQPPVAKETASRPKPAETPMDLRPKLIAKLQEMVKKGSNGLYNLSIHEAEPDVLNGTIALSDVQLFPDAGVMKTGPLPDDVFRLTVAAIVIKGIGLQDLLSKNVIDLKQIYIRKPVIEVIHTTTKKAESKETVYQRLMGQLKRLSIGKIVVEAGTLISRNSAKNKVSRFKEVAISLTDVLLDSTTQFDKHRFLFAKEALLSMKNFTLPSTNNLYDLKIGSVSISSARKLLTAKGVAYQPRYSKTEFQKHISTMKERYAITVPVVYLKNVDWWSLVAGEGFKAATVTLQDADVGVYLDRSKPAGKPSINTFPHQLLMKLPMPVGIRQLELQNARLSYEELNPLSGEVGKAFFTDINGKVQNLENEPGEMRKNSKTTVTASAKFLQRIPLTLGMQLDLARYKTGNFTASLKVENFNGPILNPVTAPLGLFQIKEGEIQTSYANIAGDNFKAAGTIAFRYGHLHVNPLEKGKSGELNKKHLTGFLANTLLLKDENPDKNGELRKPSYTVDRGGKGTFFNLLWKTTLVGILKTIGAPEKLAN